MNYPVEILPHPTFVKPFPLDRLKSELDDYHVCFRIDGSLDEYSEAGMFNGKRKLLRKCFQHMPHMSMNLFGGLFQPEYVRFVQKRPGCDDWDGEKEIDINEFLDCISEIADAVPVYYRSRVICQKNIKTTVSFNNKDAYKAMKVLFPGVDFPAFVKGIEVELTTKIDIKHVPTNLNYWHVQMEVYPQTTDKELSNDSVDWRRLIYENIRDSILRLNYEEKPSLDYTIPEEMYKN